MSGSSSEDEDHMKLVQSMDTQFIDNSLYSGTSNKNVTTRNEKPDLPPSLRYCDNDQSDQYTTSGLHITPELQKYVAKKLSSLLERNLKEVELSGIKHPKKKRKKEKGVRLFQSSTSFVEAKDDEDFTATFNAKRKSRHKEVNSKDEFEKVVESAVSSDWLLSGEATKGWAQSTKGEVIQGFHKNSNGTVKKKKKKGSTT